jgi:sugar-specific transcriptional regulator TrmB
MTEIGYTKTPRSHIVYNSIEVANEDNNMGDTQLRQALDDNRKLQEEIGVYKKQISQLKKSNTEKDKEIKEIKDSYSDVDSKLKDYEHLKEIETNYNTLISSKKDDLIHQIAGDDSQKAEKLQSWSIDQLEFQVELLSEKKPRGKTPMDTHVDDGNDPLPEDDGDEVYTDEMFEADFEASGL